MPLSKFNLSPFVFQTKYPNLMKLSKFARLAFVLSILILGAYALAVSAAGSGYHLVNRIGYLISTIPFPEDADIEVPILFESDE